MTEGNFVDYVKIHVSSGNGGKGSTHLRREKFVAMGGPDGGDGGRGGHIVIKGNKNLWTLVHYKFSGTWGTWGQTAKYRCQWTGYLFGSAFGNSGPRYRFQCNSF